jgi:phenylalanyl-tRNA synthetase beta chain
MISGRLGCFAGVFGCDWHAMWDAGQLLTVDVPPTRSDVLHPCDIAEDVAIVFGYNNIAETIPTAATVGRELPLNQLTELLRMDVAAAGFTEVLTWALCSKAENFERMRRQDEGAVEIGNPATQEFQVCLVS